MKVSIVTAVLVAAFLGPWTFSSWSMGSRVPVVGTPAEDFQLVDLTGKAHSLSEHRGKVVLLNFWATWCKPCTTEMPAMQTTYDKLREKGFIVLAVNELEDDAKVEEHIKQYGHTFPVLMDRENKVANQFGVFGLPVSVSSMDQAWSKSTLRAGFSLSRKFMTWWLVFRNKNR